MTTRTTKPNRDVQVVAEILNDEAKSRFNGTIAVEMEFGRIISVSFDDKTAARSAQPADRLNLGDVVAFKLAPRTIFFRRRRKKAVRTHS